MKILLVPSTYLPLVGGVQINTHNLAKEFKAMGNEVVVLTSKWQNLRLPKHEIIEGIKVYRTPFYVFRGSLKSFFAFIICFPIAFYQTIKTFFRFKPDIINIHFIGGNAFYIYLLRTLFKFPLIVSMRGTIEPPGLKSDSAESSYTAIEAIIMNWVATRLLNKAEHITAVSQDLISNALNFAKTNSKKYSKITIGVNWNKYFDRKKKNGKYLLGIGRLAYEKGFDVLIRSMKILPKEYSNYKLIIAGDGPERNSLDKLIERLHLKSQVKLIGFVDRARVVELIKESKIIIVPSRQEGLGKVILEALACSKPVVATKVGGIPEIVTNNYNGLLVNKEDPKALANAIITLLSDKNKIDKMGKNGFNLVKSEFNWRNVALKFYWIYKEALSTFNSN